MLLTAAGQEVSKVACFSSLLKERLLPIDTVRAVATVQSGASGMISMSFGTEFKTVTEIEVTTTNGQVTWAPKNGVKTVRRLESGEEKEEHEKIEMNQGVLAEFEAFAQSVEAGKIDPRQSPEEGLKDLRLLEALFRSGEDGAAVKSVSY